MTVPQVRVNNYVKIENVSLDILSKIFIIFEFLLGINRLTVLGIHRVILIIATCLYSVSVIGLVSYIVIDSDLNISHKVIKLTQYAVYAILGFATRVKLQEFYKELHNFDKELGSTSKITRDCVKIILEISILVLCTFITIPDVILYVMYLIYLLENQYYGYLLHLLIHKLRSINLCIETSLKNAEIEKPTEVERLSINNSGNEINMSKLMDFYYIIISANDILTDAIKNQLLLSVMISFVNTLSISLYASGSYFFHNASLGDAVNVISSMALEAMPLTVPCMRCDQIRVEVAKLRELLATKLYEKTLDKNGRSVARSFMALTKARNLSFTLFRMINVSVTLPFSFLGLVATYLIIFLQFEKVYNDTSN